MSLREYSFLPPCGCRHSYSNLHRNVRDVGLARKNLHWCLSRPVVELILDSYLDLCVRELILCHSKDCDSLTIFYVLITKFSNVNVIKECVFIYYVRGEHRQRRSTRGPCFGIQEVTWHKRDYRLRRIVTVGLFYEWELCRFIGVDDGFYIWPFMYGNVI